MTTAPPLSVQLLGPVRATHDGLEVGLGAARQRAVFTVLAVRANQAVSREELIQAVWGDAPPASAAAGVYTYVSGLRRALEPQRIGRSAASVLVSTGSGYSLRLAPGRSDVEEFEQHRRTALHAPAEEALSGLDTALALWRGEALAGVPGPFAQAQRTRLAELRLATVERRAEVALKLGRLEEVVAELTAVVAAHPLREPPRLLLMTALYRSGRTADALAVFDDGHRATVEELGVEPGPALREFRRRLVGPPSTAPGGSVPATPPAPRSVPPRSVPPRSVPPRTATPGAGTRATPARCTAPGHEPPARPDVVGRAPELDLLRVPVAALAAGRGGCVWLEGEPGVGKSALLAAALADTAPGCATVWAVGDERGTRFPLRVVLDCLDIAPSSSDPYRAAVARAMSAPESADGTPVGDPVATAVDRLLDLVDELCARSPLILVLDDFQWADEATLLLWHRLTRLTRQLPLLLVAAGRPVPRRAEVARVRRAVLGAGGLLVPLAPLPEDAVAEVVTRRLGATPSAALLRVVAQAGGNPLYAGELVDALVREGAVRVARGGAELVGDEHEVPRSLGPAVARHLDFLSGSCLEVLRWGALLGPEFTPEDVAVVLARPVSELVPAIEEATAASVLVDTASALAFRHPLIRRALHGSVPASVRAALHRRAARALAAAGAPVEVVAHQPAAEPPGEDAPVAGWLSANAPRIARRDADLAIRLIRAPVERSPGEEERLEPLTTRLVLRAGGRSNADLACLPHLPHEVVRATVDRITDRTGHTPRAGLHAPRPGVRARRVHTCTGRARTTPTEERMTTDSRAALRVDVLGPLRVWVDGTEVTVASNRQRAVLAVLAARAGRNVSRAELVAGVWGADAPAGAVSTLHTHVSGLRGALGPGRHLLRSTATGYSLRLVPGAVDGAEFTAGLAEARRLHAGGDRDGASEVLDRALALWRGEAYGDVDCPFADDARPRLARARLSALVLRARSRLDLAGAEELSDLAAELAALLREHPDEEALHEVTALALDRGGRHAEAVEVLGAARAALARFGRRPGPALRGLHERLLTGEGCGWHAPRLRVVPAEVDRAVPARLVGRDAEVSALAAAVAAVRTGRGGVVRVEGEPGIGKSALLRAALSGARGVQLAWGVADEAGGRFPLQVFVDGLGITRRADDPRRAALADQLREHRRGWWHQGTSVDRLAAFVEETCDAGPLVLVIDGLQWADDASLLLWRRLAEATRRLPLLLVAAYRPGTGAEHPAGPDRPGDLRLDLCPLGPADVATLVGDLLGGPVDGGVARSLAERSGGHPLYARMLADAHVRGNPAHDLPARLRDLVDGALAELSGAARELLRWAALLGARFAGSDLVAVTDRLPHLLSALDEVMAAGMVVEHGDALAFRHPVLREAVLEGVPPTVRLALHRQAAEALARPRPRGAADRDAAPPRRLDRGAAAGQPGAPGRTRAAAGRPPGGAPAGAEGAAPLVGRAPAPRRRPPAPATSTPRAPGRARGSPGPSVPEARQVADQARHQRLDKVLPGVAARGRWRTSCPGRSRARAPAGCHRRAGAAPPARRAGPPGVEQRRGLLRGQGVQGRDPEHPGPARIGDPQGSGAARPATTTTVSASAGRAREPLPQPSPAPGSRRSRPPDDRRGRLPRRTRAAAPTCRPRPPGPCGGRPGPRRARRPRRPGTRRVPRLPGRPARARDGTPRSSGPPAQISPQRMA